MAPEKHDFAATRERLEFLLEKDGNLTVGSPSGGSTRQAFLAGAAFSGLIAGSIFLTGFIDTKLHESEATPASLSGATNGVLGSPLDGFKSISAGGSAAGMIDSTGNGTERHSRGRAFHNTPVLSGAPNSGPINRISPETPAHNSGDVRALPMTAIPNPTSPETTPINQALVPVAGLSTSRSVITGVADPQTMTASYYWTFTLNNQTNSSKEAQMNIALPNGAVVSRATLWINGKAEEAAFNTTSQVQNAYDWIVTHNRDPLLITQTADGNINLKASPVMPKKEMKIRIGITTPMQMTADGKSQMELPHIIDANLDFQCVQNVHITSEVPLVSNDTRMNSPKQKHGFLLRGNVNAGDLQKLQVISQRDPNMARFATRATHSNPPGYIVAELQNDNQGLSTLNLTKSMTQPDCPVLKDEHAAFRLSYLWVKKEIERLAGAQDISQAEELATVYRVVSPVSGAVVLERQTDYDYNGLDRNMYKSLAYEPSDNDADLASAELNGYATRQASQPARELEMQRDVAKAPSASRPAAASMPTPSAAPMADFDKSGGAGGNMMFDASSSSRPVRSRRKAERSSEQAGVRDLRSANKISMMPVETKVSEKLAAGPEPKSPHAQKSDIVWQGRGAYSEQSIQTADEPSFTPSFSDSGFQAKPSNSNSNQAQLSNSGSNQAVRLAGPAGSKLETLARDANMLFLSGPISTAALLSLLGLTFAGGIVLYAIAALRLYRRQPGAIKFAACGALWIAGAAFVPLFSQVFTVLVATGLTVRAVLKALKPAAQ